MSNLDHQFIATVIDRYGLAADGERVDNLVATWLQKYDRTWIVRAIVECVHQGRYKLISVDRILQIWQRLGTPRLSFSAEYERDLLQDLPEPSELDIQAQAIATSQPTVDNRSVAIALPPIDSTTLDPDESAPLSHLGRLRPAAPRIEVDVATNQSADRVFATNTQESGAIIRPEVLPPIDSQLPQPANFQLFKTLKTIVDSYSKNDTPQQSTTIALPIKFSHPPQQVGLIQSSDR